MIGQDLSQVCQTVIQGDVTMEKRITFKCWKCGREYSLLQSLQDGEQPKLVVECPFCGSEGVVDLAPYRTSVISIIRNITQMHSFDDIPVEYEFDLPEVVPTAEMEESNRSE
jgi:DNA-directed RNA polymerase subunit RPC12/RpoP